MNQSHEKELTVRGQIRKGLGKKWTRELEDDLFWPIAEICEKAWENGHRKATADILAIGTESADRIVALKNAPAK